MSGWLLGRVSWFAVGKGVGVGCWAMVSVFGFGVLVLVGNGYVGFKAMKPVVFLSSAFHLYF